MALARGPRRPSPRRRPQDAGPPPLRGPAEPRPRHLEHPLFIVTEEERLPEHDVCERQPAAAQARVEAELDAIAHAHDVEALTRPDLILVRGRIAPHDEVASMRERLPFVRCEVREQELPRACVTPPSPLKQFAQTAGDVLEDEAES